MAADFQEATVAAITGIGEALTSVAKYADATTDEVLAVKEDVARHHRAIDALTELVDQCATLSDLDSLRAEMLDRTGTPFDAA